MRVVAIVSIALWLSTVSSNASLIAYSAPSDFHLLFEDGNDMALSGSFTVDLSVLSGSITLTGTGPEAGIYGADRVIGTETAVFVRDATMFLTLYFTSEFGGSPLQTELVSYLAPDGVVHTTNLPVFVAAAVPELSTWTMLLLGFVGISLMGWRKESAWRFSQFA